LHPHIDEIGVGAGVGHGRDQSAIAEDIDVGARSSVASLAVTTSSKIKVRICGFQFHVIMTDVESLLHNGTGS
jgi:hypothetical protein